MSTLTDAQQQLLAEKRLPEGERPSYYDAQRAEEVEVTADFQDFAILLDDSLYEEIEDRLGVATETDEDFNTILDRACTKEAEDAEAMLGDYETALADYNDFRIRLVAAESSGAIEVSKIQHDVRRAQDRLVEAQDHHYHRRQMAEVVSDVHTYTDNNPDATRQRESWAEAIGVYR